MAIQCDGTTLHMHMQQCCYSVYLPVKFVGKVRMCTMSIRLGTAYHL